MKMIESFNSSFNYISKTTFHAVNKIASSPGAVKKTGQLALGIIASANYSYNKDYFPDLASNFKGTIELIDLYLTVKNVAFWIYSFESVHVDKTKLIQSLNDLTLNKCEKMKIIVDSTFEKGKEANSRTEFRRFLRDSLAEEGLENADELANKAEIHLKKRYPITLITTACLTVVCVCSNLSALNRWKVINLPKLTTSVINNRFINLSFIASASLNSTIKFFNTTRFSLEFIDSIKKTWKAKQNHDVLEQKRATWDCITVGLDLIENSLPFYFPTSVSTGVAIALTIVDKTTGLTGFLLKP